jgi:hypothetical protein
MEQVARRTNRGPRLIGMTQRRRHGPQSGYTGGKYPLEEDFGLDQVLMVERSLRAVVRR